MPKVLWTQAMVDDYNRRQSHARDQVSFETRLPKNPTLKKSLTVARDPVIKESLTTESPLEAMFLDYWTKAGGPSLEREVCLVPGRKFRCDFFHRQSLTAIEIQGYRDHTSRNGFARDNEKHLLLYLLGYRVLTLDRNSIADENIRKVIARVTQ